MTQNLVGTLCFLNRFDYTCYKITQICWFSSVLLMKGYYKTYKNHSCNCVHVQLECYEHMVCMLKRSLCILRAANVLTVFSFLFKRGENMRHAELISLYCLILVAPGQRSFSRPDEQLQFSLSFWRNANPLLLQRKLITAPINYDPR